MDNLRGGILMILAMLGFAIEDVFIKLAAQSVPVGQILILIGLAGTLFYGGYALSQRQPPLPLRLLRGASGLRALCEGVAALCMVFALALVPLSLITTIIQANPLLVTLGAALFLGESVGVRRWSAIVIGLFGVLIVLRPFSATFEAATLLAVAGVVAMSARDLATRRVPGDISTAQLSVLGFVAAIPAGLIALLIAGTAPVWPDLRGAAYLAGSMAIGVPALYVLITAVRTGDIAFVAPFRYSRILFGLAAGVMVFGEDLDAMTLLGAAIIVATGLYTFWRETRLNRLEPKV